MGSHQNLLNTCTLLLLIAFHLMCDWARKRKSPRARKMAERLKLPPNDELEREIENKVLKLVFHFVVLVLGLWGPFLPDGSIAIPSILLLLAILYLYFAATWVLRYHYTAGGDECAIHPLRGLLLRIAGLTLALGLSAALIVHLPAMGGV